MTITVKTPDGGSAQFPDDTPQDAIVSAMKSKFGGPDASSSDDSALGQAGNFAYRAANTGTLHALDYGLAGVHALTGGDDLATIRAKNEDYASKHPVQALGADVVGYGAGLGKLGIASKLAEGAAGLGAGAKLANVAGQAGEAAALSGAGTLTGGGSVGDAIQSATEGGVLGGSLGAAIGNRGRALAPALSDAKAAFSDAGGGLAGAKAAVKDFRGPTDKPPVTPSLDDLQAAKDARYAKLESTPVKATTVGDAFKSALGELTPGQQAQMSPGMAGRLKQVSDVLDTGQPLTLGDVDGFARAVGKGNIPKSTDAVIGAKVGEALTSLAPEEFKAARLAQGSLSDAQMLTKGLDASKWYKGAFSADTIAEAANRTRPDARTIFSDAGGDAMRSLAKAGPGTGGKMLDAVIAPTVNRGVGAAVGALGGGVLGHEALGALVGQSGLGSGGIGSWLARMRTNASARRAMKAALAATSTGEQATADMYRNAPWLRQAALASVKAKGQSGAFGP